MLSKSEINKILCGTPQLADRIAPFNVDSSTDLRTINKTIKQIETHERQYGGVWGIALLQNSSIGGVYQVMSMEEYKHYRATVVSRPIQFWPKSYFSNLKQKLESAS